jgi:hypothetical protein
VDVRYMGVGGVTGFGDCGLVGAWRLGAEGLTGVHVRACAPARRRGSIAPAETSFVLRRGQLNSMGSGHCVFTCDSARGLHEENETETETVEI